MKKTITRNEYLQLLGLFVLGKEHSDRIKDIDRSAARILEVELEYNNYSGYVGDELYGDCNVDNMLRKMEISVESEVQDADAAKCA